VTDSGDVGGSAGPGERSTATPETTPDSAPQWNRTYGTDDGGDALFGAAEGIDGGHFVVGGSTAATGGDEFDEWALKLDSDGETEWDRVPTDDEGTNILTSATAVSDGYVVSGFSSDQETVYDARLRKFGPDGEDLWDRTFERHQGFTVLPADDDGYVVAGAVIERDPDAWLQAVDSDGSDRWSETIDDGGNEVIFGGERVDDGYLFSGYSTTEDTTRGYLLKADARGSKRWSETFTVDGNAELNAVVAVDDGYVAVGVTYEGSEDGTTDDAGLVIKVDEDGSKQWSTTIDASDGGRLEGIVRGADDNLYAAGDRGADTVESSDSGWVVELDSGGSEVDSTVYGNDEYDILTDVHSTATGAYLLTGETDRSGQDHSDGWVVKATDPIAGVPDE